MFERLRKAFSRGTAAPPAAAPVPARPDPAAFAPVAEWAALQGWEFAPQAGGFLMQGKVGGQPCRLEVGRSSRKYIQGEELRGRADLGIDPDVMVVLVNRPLKDALVKQAYSLFTDTLQTSIDPNLPEEMRLLSMYEEVGWDSMPRVFWTRYSVVPDARERAQAWLDASLGKQLLEWPAPAPAADQPFMLQLLRGKAYLRMQHGMLHMPTLQHAVANTAAACENALGAFPVKKA
jgi:hypothetical protein